jgi:BirA family transcriptional regulator, biotin operon repressor / biotin---[acetyl-CoA-carboxylase] ligase
MTPISVGPFAASCGHRVEFLETVGSTNTEAMARARSGAARTPLWIVGGEQTSGRGRLDRRWASPPGNLYASLALIDPCPPERAPELGFVAGVALAQAVRETIGLVAGLKWPNDLMASGAKLSGMLLEATRLPSGDFAAVIGIGVNCRSHPDGLAYATTDLETLKPGAGDPATLFAHLSDAMARALLLWARGTGFGALREKWLASALGLGGPIRVALGARTVEGIFETIDPHGRLVVLTAQGSISIDAGDVLLGAQVGAPRGAGDRGEKS